MVDPIHKPSNKADRPERRPGLGLAQRGAGRGASCRKKHCKMGRSCCRSRTPSFADRVAAAVPPGCGKMRCLRRCAPRLRSPGYDLRRAPCIHPHFISNAIREGLNQRFLSRSSLSSRVPEKAQPRGTRCEAMFGECRRVRVSQVRKILIFTTINLHSRILARVGKLNCNRESTLLDSRSLTLFAIRQIL